MTTSTVERMPAPIVEFRHQLETRAAEFAAALPSHIKPEHFQRAAVTAAQNNPDLLGVERRSLLNALMRCAQDGLIPDGRQAALVIFKSRERGPIAQYFPMVAGIRKLVQQSGEITRFEQHIVYERDEFDFALGDDAHIHHRPHLAGNRGHPILAYSIAEFRSGARSREVMTREEIEQVRAVSRAGNDGPWRYWWSEMARKTVAKRHAKSLPMSNDVDAMLARDDETPSLAPAPEPVEPLRRPAMIEAFDRLADPPSADEEPAPARRRRGRPRKETPINPDMEPAPDDAASLDPEPIPDPETSQAPDPAQGETVPGDDGWPGPDPDDMRIENRETPIPNDPDYRQGMADAEAGRRACLDPAIRQSERRFMRWRAGFYAATKGPTP